MLSSPSQPGLSRALSTITLLLRSKVLQGTGSGSKYVRPELSFQAMLLNGYAISS